MSVPPSHFEQLYAERADPWDIEDRWSEQRKRDIVMAMLPDQRFGCAVEPGCANGALTVRLAERVERLYAFDAVEVAVEATRRRTRLLPHVEVTQDSFPEFWPTPGGDLAVWSEVAYYLDQRSLEQALSGLERWLQPNGVLLAVHYLGPTNNPLTGRAVMQHLEGAAFLSNLALLTEERFALGVWRRNDIS